MPRIRTIKPEFPLDEAIGRVSRNARYLLLLMKTIADDAGRLRGHPRYLAHALFPYDDDADLKMLGWLSELEREAQIKQYQVEGNQFIQLVHWLRDERIDHPQQSQIQAPPSVQQLHLPIDDAPRAPRH